MNLEHTCPLLVRVLSFDLIVHGGLILDGSGQPAFEANVCIEGGRISEISSIDHADALEVVNASGLAVAPGFIDMHTHSDFILLVNPRAESKIRQGVTTEVIGNCGNSAAPLLGPAREQVIRQQKRRYDVEVNWKSFDDYLDKLEEGVALNVAALVGHGTVRQCVMDMEERAPTGGELGDMQSLVAEAMEEGAFGLSSGLVYPPGRYADTAELVELCREVSRFGGIYASHIRGERETLLEAVEEALRIGEEAGVSVQISHHPAKIGAWGKSPETLVMVDEAVNRGLNVTCDLHPYVAGSTGMSALLPPWVQEGGTSRIMERLRDQELRHRIKVDMIEERIPGPGPCGLVKRGMWDQIIVSSYPTEELVGRTVAEIAGERGVDLFDAYFDLMLESEAEGDIVGFYYNEEDIRAVLAHPCSIIGSDGSALAPYGVLGKGRSHPRSYGTFPMIFRKYVRGETRSDLWNDSGGKVILLEEAVMKMTSAPAEKLGLHDRGFLRPGMWADIVVFDPKTMGDEATYLDPYRYPTGVVHVFVNGVSVISGGEHTGALPGKSLRHTA
jgi:N-acyl-D-amino-acid deacylase